VFGAVLAISGVVWLVLAREHWFVADDWDFVANRKVGSASDLFDDHYGHWSTIPVLFFRGMWAAIGLRSYLPYVACVVALHLTAAALLRVVMRRVGVDPWIATAAASAFALFGTGWQNIVWAVQFGMNSALVFGLVQLLLADHDGPVDRHDWLGLAAGCAALMSANLGVVMVAVVGIATFIRRGHRMAMFHVLPPAIVFLVWWLAIGREGANETSGFGTPGIKSVLEFVAHGFRGTFGDLGQLPGLGVALAVLMIVGLPLAWWRLSGPDFRRKAASPLALLGGSVIFFLVTGYTRAAGFVGPELARASRYEHAALGLLIVPIAVALDAFARRSRVLLPLACALLAIGVPGNIEALADETRARAPAHRHYRRVILAIANHPLAPDIPAEARVDTAEPNRAYITVGWLRDAAASGRAPPIDSLSPSTEAEALFRMSFVQRPAETAATSKCEPLTTPRQLRLRPNDSMAFTGGQMEVSMASGDLPTLILHPEYGEVVTATRGPLDIVVSPRNPFFFTPPRLCTPSP
jgi:hypothetical protein